MKMLRLYQHKLLLLFFLFLCAASGIREYARAAAFQDAPRWSHVLQKVFIK